MIKQNTVAGLVVMVAALISCVAASAQQQNQSGSSGQAAQGTQSSSQQGTQPAAPAAVTNQPVTGSFMGFLNTFEEGRSMLQFGFNASESADSNPTGVTSGYSTLAMTSVSGDVTLQKVGRRSDLTLGVTAGGIIYDTNSSYDAAMAGLNFGDSIQFRRWTLVLGDQLYFLPETPFGFYGGLLGGLGFGSLGGLATPTPLEGPTSSILSLQNQQLNESAQVQANYSLSARSTWTVNAGYNIVDYTHGGFLPASSYSVGTGYNYQLGQRDTIGVGFTYTVFDYGVGTNSMDSYAETLSYGHRFTDRLAVELSGGGDEYEYASPTQSSRLSQLTYVASGALSYQWHQTHLQLSGSRNSFGGAGYLYGGILDVAQASAARPITRFWVLSGAVGYSLASGLNQTPTAGGSYQSLYGVVSASRKFSPNVSLFFQGFVAHQAVSGSLCVTGINCAAPFNQYMASVGVQWNFRPIPLD
jgi:outer membrane protein W